MRTEDLIAELSARPVGTPGITVGRGVGAAFGLGLVVALAVYLACLHPRADLVAALSHPIVAAKTVLPLVLGGLALTLALGAARPAAPRSRAQDAIWLVPVAAVVLFVLEFFTTPPAARMAAFVGHSIPVCLPLITLLAAPAAILTIRALRAGAPVHPARCGALAGLAAAGFAAALYSTFCTEDSPLFYAVWYSAGIGIVTAAGAVAGARFLRW